MSSSIPVTLRRSPGCLIQLLWFIFVGWWLGALAVAAAYFMFVFIITIPFGVVILNNVPKLMALRQPPQAITPYGAVAIPQINILVRALWFAVVGWWLTAIVLAVAYALCLSIIGLPFGFLLFDSVPAFLTLRRS